MMNGSISTRQFYEEINPFVLDLIAYFNIMEEEIYKLIAKGEAEGWEPEKIIDELGKII